MKKAIQLAICILAALLAVEPVLAAVDCGQRMNCAGKLCPGCCSHMEGMPTARHAMHCGQTEQSAAMAARNVAPPILGERESKCDRAIQEPPQYAGVAPWTGEIVLMASGWVGPVTLPESSFRPNGGESSNAAALPRYLLFRVFRI